MDLGFALFCSLYTFFVGAIVYTGKNIYVKGTKYKLKKQLDINNVDKVILPPALKQSLTELPSVQNEVLKKALIEFTEVLKTNFSEKLLENFYTNLNSLTIEEEKFINWIKTMIENEFILDSIMFEKIK